VLPTWPVVVLFERSRGGGAGHVSMAKWARFCILNSQEMPGSSEQGRALLGLCIPRSLPRWHDPNPLGGLSPAYLLEFLKGRCGGAWAVYRVLSEEAEEFNGYHCLGRSLQDSAHPLVQLLCHHCTVSSRLVRCTKRAGHGRPRADRP
jgi:hypothetical protein